VGIDAASAQFLAACRDGGVDYSRTITLGRQQMLDGSGYAEGFLGALGAEHVDSLDASAFEGATVVADLNHDLPAELRRRYSAVIDAGTLEHVFDLATALRSVLDLVAPNGHYIAISPANNWPGHGFYQFSPELLFRVLSPDAGFRIRGAFVIEHRSKPRWLTVADPAAVGERVAWRNRHRTSLAVVAQRVRIVDLATFVPQQSDYAARWETSAEPVGSGPTHTLKRLVWRAAPSPARHVYEAYVRRRRDSFDERYFRPIQASELALQIAPSAQDQVISRGAASPSL
jgi:SAM-dependent methyltransferase